MKFARAAIALLSASAVPAALSIGPSSHHIRGADADAADSQLKPGDFTSKEDFDLLSFCEERCSANEKRILADDSSNTTSSKPLPNIVVFMVDDLGWNQVGYHANPAGNMEISTPIIDKHALEGIQVERSYATPWCGPSRAAFQVGTLAAYNENVTQSVWSFGPDTGFIGGLPPEIMTLPKALKEYAQSIGEDYATSYSGKWGLQGATWTNSPMGAGYDEVRGFPEHSADGCDGMLSFGCRGPPGDGGGTLARSIPAYWEQGAEVESDLCEFFQGLDQLTEEEKHIACHSQPRELPKLIDEDLVDYTKRRILNHDFSEKPLYHMHSMQLMHSPIAYPLRYNEDHPNPNVDLPDYFKEGQEKPPPSNDDMRLSAANAMRFVDDVFDEVMEAIKQAGQWENTIVLFTSDNGGAIFPQSINNNFPLRGGKRSIFDGGYRVVQFLTGGWLDQAQPQQQPPQQGRKSDTFVFINDWAPTFLDMVGGSAAVDKLYTKELDSNGNLDPMEGNPMWKYIQNSVSEQTPKQLPRKVSYNKDLFFDVTEEATHKLMVTPDGYSVFYIRKWAPVWPEGEDLTPDFGYVSVMPCRPEGPDKPQECCRFNVVSDPGEDEPEIIDKETCEGYKLKAESLYLGHSTTPETSVAKTCQKPDGQNWKYPTIACKDFGDHSGFTNEIDVDKEYGSFGAKYYSLWTQYGAAGPFVSYNKETKEAKRVDHYATKCVCETIDPNITPSDVDAYLPTIASPSVCISTEKTTFAYSKQLAVPCNGFSRTPTALGLQEYGYQGANQALMDTLASFERQGPAFAAQVSEALYQSGASYNSRRGFTEWPAMGKWPFITPRWNTCQRKNATAMPIGVASSSPWSQSSGDGGDRFRLENMCQIWNETHSWCPSVFNPLQTGIKEYDIMGEWAELSDGSRFFPIPRDDCSTTCEKAPVKTAYIGSTAWGMAYGGGGAPAEENGVAPAEDDGGAPAEDEGAPAEDDGGATVPANALTTESDKEASVTAPEGSSSGRIKMISTIVTGMSMLVGGAFLLSA